MSSGPTAANAVRAVWDRLRRVPAGGRLFSLVIRAGAPYSATIGPRVVALGAGHAKVVMRDRRAVRNHLRCVHAAALMNLGELTSGLAMAYGLPPTARGIITAFDVEYLKKARGTLTAESRFEVPDASVEREHEIGCEIRDASGEVVARTRARWLIGPRPDGRR